MQTPQQKLRWFERLGYALPRLERDDRKALLERVEAGADGGVDYLTTYTFDTVLQKEDQTENLNDALINALR